MDNTGATLDNVLIKNPLIIGAIRTWDKNDFDMTFEMIKKHEQFMRTYKAKDFLSQKVPISKKDIDMEYSVLE